MRRPDRLNARVSGLCVAGIPRHGEARGVLAHTASMNTCRQDEEICGRDEKSVAGTSGGTEMSWRRLWS